MTWSESLLEIVRDAPLGQLLRFFTHNRVLQYPEENPDFKLPEAWNQLVLDLEKACLGTSHIGSGEPSTIDNLQAEKATINGTGTTTPDIESSSSDEQGTTRCTKNITKDGTILVDWYSDNDPANPHNWSPRRRLFVGSLIAIYTGVVYVSSSIYTPSVEGVMEEFHVSNLTATLGLAMYVLGYGIGPLLFSPLGEIARIGRNPVYFVTILLFVVFSIPTPFVNTFAGLIILRFLQGFFGSPCLAAGGATLGDLYGLEQFPFAMVAWVSAMSCGPALGPLLSTYAVSAKGWRWSLLEIIWMSAPLLLLYFVLMPETSGPSILLQRARRLRKATGNQRLKSQSEIDQAHLTVSNIAVDALIKPLEITIKDPAILFVQVYAAIVYGIYYSYFEVFPMVYPAAYGMGMHSVSLVFICIGVGSMLAAVGYWAYLYFVLMPQIKKSGLRSQEQTLLAGLPICFGPTIGLFTFAWTARSSIHWIVPTLGVTLYAGSVFTILQCIFLYVPFSYPRYAASLFAANDFFRSALACGSILFAHPLYHNLGFAKGTSLLGGLSVIGILGMWWLYFYGAKLRAMSKFTG